MKVTHHTYGIGQVVSQDENNVTVDFNGIVKTLVIKFSKLTNEDGAPFGTQYITADKKKKKTSAEKRMAFERTLTEDQKRELSFLNPDGTKNHNAYNDFLEERAKKAFESKSF